MGFQDFEADRSGRRIPSWSLWIVQGLLATLFLLTGGMKLLAPIAMLTQQMPELPGVFVRFIGVCELLGALGLVLPGLLCFRTELTPLAAGGLVIIMIGATVCTVLWFGALMALLPVLVGLLAAFVAYGRWRVTPLGSASPRLGVLRWAQSRSSSTTTTASGGVALP